MHDFGDWPATGLTLPAMGRVCPALPLLWIRPGVAGIAQRRRGQVPQGL